jgi:hypothetical protein
VTRQFRKSVLLLGVLPFCDGLTGAITIKDVIMPVFEFFTIF